MSDSICTCGGAEGAVRAANHWHAETVKLRDQVERQREATRHAQAEVERLRARVRDLEHDNRGLEETIGEWRESYGTLEAVFVHALLAHDPLHSADVPDSRDVVSDCSDCEVARAVLAGHKPR